MAGSLCEGYPEHGWWGGWLRVTLVGFLRPCSGCRGLLSPPLPRRTRIRWQTTVTGGSRRDALWPP